MTEGELLHLIDEYLKFVRQAVSELVTRYGRKDLLRAWHSRAIPKRGRAGGVAFDFHGVGCYFVVDKVEVNMDFGPDDRIDGFDAWRLHQFARQRPSFAGYSLADIEAGLDVLLQRGVVEKPGKIASEHLYFFTDRTDRIP